MDSRAFLVKMLEKYKLLFDAVQVVRFKSTYNQSHGIDHDLFVAQYGYLIAENERIGELAWVAGVMHSLDRLTERNDIFSKLFRRIGKLSWIAAIINGLKKMTGGSDVFLKFFQYLPDTISSSEKELIAEALRNHSKLNDPADNPLTVVLKDADRISNIGPLDLIRLGMQRNDMLPIVIGYSDVLSPGSTFKEHGSAWDAIHFNLEWREMLRCSKAIVIAKKYFDFFEQCIALNKVQLTELGLDQPL